MSSKRTFAVFQDVQTASLQPPAALDSQPTMPSFNSGSSISPTSLRPSNTQQPSGMRPCKRCQHWKPRTEFYVGRVPLAEVDNNALDSQQDALAKLSTNCRTCREKRQPHNKRISEIRRNQADESKRLHIKVSTWESEDVQK